MAEQHVVVPLQLGTLGLWGTSNQAAVPPNALIDALNLTFSDDTLQKEGGAEKFNSTAVSGTPSIIGGHYWNHDGDTSRMVIVTDASKFWKCSVTGAVFSSATGVPNSTILSTGPSLSSELATFAEGGKEAAANNRKLFIFTGLKQVQVLSADGATSADITTPPADWAANFPRIGEIHEGRLWGAGNSNDSHRLYYSTTSDHEDFTGATSGSISIFPGDGEKIVALHSYTGALVVMKYPEGIYVVDTSDPDVTRWKVTPISRKVGCAGVLASTQTASDVTYIDNSGEFRALSQTDKSSGYETSPLVDPFNMQRWLRDNLTTEDHWRWVIVYYPLKREVHLCATGKGSANLNNYRVVMDISNPGTIRWRYSNRDDSVSAWVASDIDDQDPTLITADNAGFLWVMDRDNRNKDNSGYPSTWQTPHMDLTHLDIAFAGRRKEGKFLELVAEPTGNYDIDVDILWDGDYHETVRFNMGPVGAVLGTFVIGEDELGQDVVLNRRRRITGGGRRISLKGRNTGNNENFSLSTAYLHLLLGDQRLD